MSGTTLDVLGPIASPQNRWTDDDVQPASVLEEVVLRSNLLGADRALAGGELTGFGRPGCFILLWR